jgi:ATP-dependent Clp protease ATP-binding subunit ClpA
MFPVNRFTFKAQEALQEAQNKTFELHHAEIRGIHILWGILVVEETIISDILKELKVNSDLLLHTLEDFDRNKIAGQIYPRKIWDNI